MNDSLFNPRQDLQSLCQRKTAAKKAHHMDMRGGFCPFQRLAAASDSKWRPIANLLYETQRRASRQSRKYPARH
jgi:hypothetical protein